MSPSSRHTVPCLDGPAKKVAGEDPSAPPGDEMQLLCEGTDLRGNVHSGASEPDDCNLLPRETGRGPVEVAMHEFSSVDVET